MRLGKVLGVAETAGGVSRKSDRIEAVIRVSVVGSIGRESAKRELGPTRQ
jgi:hypothetical protein